MPFRRTVEPGVVLGERGAGVRKPVELEVVDGPRAGVELVEHPLERFRPLDRAEQEGRHALDGDVDQDAQGTESEARGRQQLGVLGLAHPQDRSVRRDQGDRDDLPGQPHERRAGAVRPGRCRSADRLPVDVAHVLHGESVRAEQRGQLVEPGTRRERHPGGRRIHRQQAVEPGEVELDARSSRDRGETVPGADGLDTQAALPCVAQDGDNLVDTVRTCDQPRPDALGAAPIAPGRAGHESERKLLRTHRNALPMPR